MNIKRFLRNLVLVLITVFWSTLIQMLNGDKTIFSLFKTTKSTEESWIVFSLSIAMVFFISWSCKQIVNTFKIRPNSVFKINLKYDLYGLCSIFATCLILFQVIIPYNFPNYFLVYLIFISLLGYQSYLIFQEEKYVLKKFEKQQKHEALYDEFIELYNEMKDLHYQYYEIIDDVNASAKRLKLVNTFSEIVERKSKAENFHFTNSCRYPHNDEEREVYDDYWVKRNFLFNKLKSTIGYDRNKESIDYKIITTLKTIEQMNADPDKIINIALTKSSYNSDWFKMCFKEYDSNSTPLNKLEALSSYYYSLIISLSITLISVKKGILLLEKDFVTGQTDYEKYNAQFNLLKNRNEFEIVLKSLFAEMK